MLCFSQMLIIATFPPKNVCEDKDATECSKLFVESQPHSPCTFNAAKRKWMSVNCRKSCNMCKKTGDCFDEDALCPYNAEQMDYCTNKNSPYHTFMVEKCKYSCGFCKDEE